MLSTLHHINIIYFVRNLPVHLQEPLGVLGQLSFGRSHLVLLRQQLVLQLQQLVLTLLNCRQQLLLVLWGNDVIEWKNKANSFRVTLFPNVIQMFREGEGGFRSSDTFTGTSADRGPGVNTFFCSATVLSSFKIVSSILWSFFFCSSSWFCS